MSDRSADLVALLPHRPPMRLVENVIEAIPGVSARATRRAKPDDWYFDGHFPGRPVVPAIVLVELLAQTGGLAASSQTPDGLVALRVAAFGPFKFPAAAGPGALLDAVAHVAGRMGALTKIEGRVTVDGTLVASGSLTLADIGPETPDR